MTDSILRSALKLSKSQRILLVERLWDSIAESNEAPPLNRSQKAELDRRLRRLRETGPLGADWATVKSRITRRPRA